MPVADAVALRDALLETLRDSPRDCDAILTALGFSGELSDADVEDLASILYTLFGRVTLHPPRDHDTASQVHEAIAPVLGGCLRGVVETNAHDRERLHELLSAAHSL